MDRRQALHREASLAPSARTSLTSRLQALRLQARAASPQDSYAAFSSLCKLPSGANPRLAPLLYYLMCLPTPVAAEDLALLKADAPQVKIVAPDIQALRSFLACTGHAGACCAELRHFLEHCVTGLSKRELSHTTVLRLYLATYCAPDLVRGLWDYVLGEAGHVQTCNEVEATIQAYLQERPRLALRALLETLL